MPNQSKEWEAWKLMAINLANLPCSYNRVH